MAKRVKPTTPILLNETGHDEEISEEILTVSPIIPKLLKAAPDEAQKILNELGVDKEAILREIASLAMSRDGKPVKFKNDPNSETFGEYTSEIKVSGYLKMQALNLLASIQKITGQKDKATNSLFRGIKGVAVMFDDPKAFYEAGGVSGNVEIQGNNDLSEDS